MVVFEGADAVKRWVAVVNDLEGSYLSPGGAASALHVSRQYIHRLVDAGQVRAWAVLERPDFVQGLASGGFTKRLTYMVVAYADIVRYGIRTGRYVCFEDLEYVGSFTREEFDAIMQENQKIRKKVDRVTAVGV